MPQRNTSGFTKRFRATILAVNRINHRISRSFSMSEHVTEVSDSSFETDVLKSDQPVLVDFWAAWCAPCRMLAPTVEAVAEKYAGNARVVKLNVDDNPSVSQ